MEVNRASLAGLNTSFNTIFNGALGGVVPTWDKVAMMVPSTTRENDYRWLGKLKGMREWVGDRVIENVTKDGYKVVNRKFENTVGVDRDDIEDDQIGQYDPLVRDLAQTAGEFPDELVWNLMKAGFTELCYDGQFFFDTDHPVIGADGAETSVSNFAGGAGTPWFLLDTTRAIKPMIYQNRRPAKLTSLTNMDDPNVFMRDEFLWGVDMRCNAGFGLWQLAYASKQELTADNYMAARAAMQDMKGDHGRQLRLKPTLLVVPGTLEKKGLEVLKAERDAAGATNVAAGTATLHVESLLAA